MSGCWWGHAVWNDLSVTDGPASGAQGASSLGRHRRDSGALDADRCRARPGWLLDLRGDGTQDTWAASGPDLFEALRNLRRLVDPLGFRLAFNGARRDAWASGMQRDMGEGRDVYLLEPGQTDQVGTLGTAPIELIGSVAEQEEHYAHWLNSRG